MSFHILSLCIIIIIFIDNMVSNDFFFYFQVQVKSNAYIYIRLIKIRHSRIPHPNHKHFTASWNSIDYDVSGVILDEL